MPARHLHTQPATPARGLPEHIRLANYPHLQQLAWQLGPQATLTPAQLLALVERNHRHLDARSLQPHELALLADLQALCPGGRLLV